MMLRFEERNMVAESGKRVPMKSARHLKRQERNSERPASNLTILLQMGRLEIIRRGIVPQGKTAFAERRNQS